MILEPKKIKSATVSFPSQSIYLEVNITILTPEKLDLDILVLKDPIINLDYLPSNFYSGLWGGKKNLKIYLFAVFECMSLGVLLTSKNNFPYTSEHSPQTPMLQIASLCIFYPQIAVEGESVIYWSVLNNLKKTSLQPLLLPQDPLWASKRTYF